MCQRESPAVSGGLGVSLPDAHVALLGPHPGRGSAGAGMVPTGPGPLPAGQTLRLVAKQKPAPFPCFCLNLTASCPRTLTDGHLGEDLLLPGPPRSRGPALRDTLRGPGSQAPDSRSPGQAILAQTCHLNVLRHPAHINMQPLKFNKKHTNYKSYLPSQINHGPWRVYARTPDFSS